MMTRFLQNLHCSRRGFLRDKRGVSAVEFALVAPIFLLLLSGTVELGGMLYTRFQLNSAVSAAATYSVLNGSTLTAATAPTLATNAAAVVAGNTASSVAVTVNINNAFSRSISGGAPAQSGNAAVADQCFCPTRVDDAVSWGSALACESLCPNGSVAGKFVAITASRPYLPLFSGYQIVNNGQIRVTTLAQVR
jgi:Flp pilus assembly pilin Flp